MLWSKQIHLSELILGIGRSENASFELWVLWCRGSNVTWFLRQSATWEATFLPYVSNKNFLLKIQHYLQLQVGVKSSQWRIVLCPCAIATKIKHE